MESENTQNRKVKKGIVVSDKMQDTVVVAVKWKMRHPKYNKVVLRMKKFYAHNEGNTAKIGDEVTICETRPLSKLKRWRVLPTATV
jgi:small subunit ribosomal protein S17